MAAPTETDRKVGNAYERGYSENKRAKTSRFSERDTARSRGDNLK
jgi:hypothetical protein